MINISPPNDWRALQNDVAQILSECSFTVEVEKTIRTVRGNAEVDVFAEDTTSDPTLVYVCECKHWKTSVPQHEVHAFRTVVADYGANWGFVISSSGFQSGAFEAAESSNIRLLDWSGFEALFEERWFRQHFMTCLADETEPLVDYTEPINTRVFRSADKLSLPAQEEFRQLRVKHAPIAFFCLHMYLHAGRSEVPSLPLGDTEHPPIAPGEPALPPDVFCAEALRGLLECLLAHVQKGVAEFDALFGGRV